MIVANMTFAFGRFASRTSLTRRFASFGLLLLTLLLLTGVTRAATHYILPAGSGSNSGADWNNACAGFSGVCNPSQMVRGDTYYVGGGSYSSVTFNTSESGTLLITIKGATAADNGTSTGWTASHGVDVTPATFSGGWNVFNGYVVIDGNTGSGTIGSSYGFTISIPTCSSVIDIGIGSGPSTIHNVTISHFYLPGCIADTQTQGIALQTQTTGIGLTYSHNYLNNWQNAIFDLNGTNLTINQNYITNGQSYSDHHGELLDFLNSETNITISNNLVVNCSGTACMAANDTGSTCSGGISGAIYGNTFSTASNIGNGIVGPTSRCYFTNTLVYNNTFTGTSSGLPWFQGCTSSAATCSLAVGNVVENNIVWNASCTISPNTGITTDDYNSYLSCADTAPAETHGQVANFNPFVNAASNNFQPAAAAVLNCSSTTATCAGLPLLAPFNLDPNGLLRSVVSLWQRGAYTYQPSNAPQPISGSINFQVLPLP